MCSDELHGGQACAQATCCSLLRSALQVCVTPNLQMGVTFGATTLGMWFCFAGFLIQRPFMPPWWKWFSYLCPPAWSIYAIVVDQLGDKVRFSGMQDFQIQKI